MIGIRGARLELQGFVPASRLVVLSMDEKCPNTGDVGGCGGSEQCVLDERLAQASSLDLQQIWRRQDVSDELKEALSRCARDVAVTIKATPPQMKNISEYCKRQACWAAVSNLKIGLGVDLKRSTVDRNEAGQRKREALAGKRLDDEIDFDVLLVSLIPHVSEIRRLAESKGLLSPKSSAGLLKMAAAKLNFTKGEKNALRHLLNKLSEDGFTLAGSDA